LAGGQCQQRAEGSGNFWVPLLAGFVIANAIDDLDFDRKKKRKYAPIYMSRANGNYYYGGSNYGPMSRTSSGRYGFAPDTLNRPGLGAARAEPRRHRLARRLWRTGEQPQQRGLGRGRRSAALLDLGAASAIGPRLIAGLPAVAVRDSWWGLPLNPPA
jgi:hypothetical protein